jgi:hypothetical protein
VTAMLYSLQFFALSAEKLAGQMANSPGKLLEKLRRRLKRELKSNACAIESIAAAAEAICRGDVPVDAPQPYFDALYALLDACAEPAPLSGFEFGSCDYLDQVGIWAWTQKESPPFPLPRKKHPPPEFGFLSTLLMREVVLPGIADLPPNGDVQLARNQFEEAVESIADDDLDLITYFTVW